MRLSQDGLTEISNYGMYDYFRDSLSSVRGGKVIGGWDIHNKVYTLSTQPGVNTAAASRTVTFDESVLGWPSFFSYTPDFIFSLANTFYSIFDGDIYQHYSNNVNRAYFYNTDNASSVTTIFNTHPSLVKSFKTINYEGGNNWSLASLTTNLDTANPVEVFTLPASLADFENDYLKNTFKPKEDKYFANIINTTPIAGGEVIFGKSISGVKGFFATATFSATNTATSGTNELFAVTTEFAESSY